MPNAVVNATQRWIEDVVIGLNFCPFAKKVVVNQSIDFQVDSSDAITSALTSLQDKLQQLDDSAEIETSLLIYSGGFTDFEFYLDLYDAACQLIDQAGYAGIYQLASFHPDYLFEGEAGDDASHYTNRSPYPMLHILREDSMAKILQQYPDPERIPVTNIQHARKLGQKKLAQLLLNCVRTFPPNT